MATASPDIVVANCCVAQNIGVLLGNGDGTFKPVVLYGTGGELPWSVAVADVNGDGVPDILVANTGDASVGVLLGNGDGTFKPVVVHPTGARAAFAVTTGDVNRDGKPDLIVAASGDYYGEAVVLIGNGGGTFQAPVSYFSGSHSGAPMSVTTADVNGDGKLDILLPSAGGRAGTCTGADSVSVLLGNGDGTFKPAVAYGSGGCWPQQVAVADVNGDGKPDLVVANECDSSGCANGSLGVLLGNGDGTFQTALNYSAGGYIPASVLAADLNGDGKPDVVVAHYYSNPSSSVGSVSVLLNNTPFCTTPPVITLSATPTSLWPPNGKMVPVTISGAITDTNTGCTVKTAAYAMKDEYGEVQPSGPVTLSRGGSYSFTVLLQSSRLGTDLDGRLYTITVSASNNAGKTGSQAGAVIVPHDQGH